jgi:Type IV secretion system pilin
MYRHILQSLCLALLFVGVAISLPQLAYAACPSDNTSKGQVLQGVGQGGGDCKDTQVTNTVEAAVSLLSYVAGIAAVFMIVLSGFRYITSGGDSAKVGAAKNALIYALVGVAVVVLARVLVSFVINKAAA